MQFDQAYQFLITELEVGLPRWLTYHNVHHTKEVVAAAQYLAGKEGISHYDYLLLSTAAAFHDAGFLEGYDDHEAISCNIARTHLPSFGYSDKEIEVICSLIMVTKPPQAPENELEKILCDADLHYLGTDTYATISENLFLEFKEVGVVKNREEWFEKQSSFLKEHQFFTPTAKAEYEEKKAENCKTVSGADGKDL